MMTRTSGVCVIYRLVIFTDMQATAGATAATRIAVATAAARILQDLQESQDPCGLDVAVLQRCAHDEPIAEAMRRAVASRRANDLGYRSFFSSLLRSEPSPASIGVPLVSHAARHAAEMTAFAVALEKYNNNSAATRKDSAITRDSSTTTCDDSATTCDDSAITRDDSANTRDSSATTLEPSVISAAAMTPIGDFDIKLEDVHPQRSDAFKKAAGYRKRIREQAFHIKCPQRLATAYLALHMAECGRELFLHGHQDNNDITMLSDANSVHRALKELRAAYAANTSSEEDLCKLRNGDDWIDSVVKTWSTAQRNVGVFEIGFYTALLEYMN